MSKNFKIILIALLVVTIASAALAVFAFMGKEKEYMKRVLLEDKLAATVKEKRSAEKALKVTKEKVDASELKITELEKKAEEFATQIDEVKERNKKVAQQLADKEKAIAKLELDIAKERKEKMSVSNKLTAMEADYDKAKKDIAKLTKEKSDLEKKMAGMEEKVVSLDPIVVTPSLPVVTSPAATETKEPLRGRVLVVNREYSFVVTDLGQKDGITPGMVFELRDGEVLLAKSEIEKVYDTMSSATLMPGADLSKIKKGNLVIESQ